MDGLLIFDQQNDVIYTKCNNQMKTKLHDLAIEQELVEADAVRAVYFVCILQNEISNIFAGRNGLPQSECLDPNI